MYLAVHGIQRSIFSFQTHVIVLHIDVGKHSCHFFTLSFHRVSLDEDTLEIILALVKMTIDQLERSYIVMKFPDVYR